MLHDFQFVFYEIQSVNALFKALGELGEERRNLGIFEVLEF
jgi:hypothetical protein